MERMERVMEREKRKKNLVFKGVSKVKKKVVRRKIYVGK